MYRYFALAVVVLLLFSSCHSRYIRKSNKKIERQAERLSGGSYTEYTPASYVARYKDIAIEEMKQHGVPASITLAQGILESGNGNSKLARYANNHFGIKCTPDWEGQRYYQDDDKRNDCFRVYDSPEASFQDHSLFLTRKRYAHLFRYKTTAYKKWAKGLKKAGYATNPRYPRLLINIIEEYDLDQYDRKQKKRKVYKAPSAPQGQKQENPKRTTDHTVQSGDTLHNISKRYGCTVEDLQRANRMKGTTIYVGQRLTIPQ